MLHILKRIVSLAESMIFRTIQVGRYFGRPSNWKLFQKAAATYQCSVYRVALRAFRLYLIERIAPDEVVERGLADPKWPLARYPEHLCDARLHGLQGGVNPDLASVCRDKLMFHSHCKAHGLPVPKLYAVLSYYGSRTDGPSPTFLHSEAALRSFESDEMPECAVIKPRTGNKGRDVRLLDSRERHRSQEGSRVHQLLEVSSHLSPKGDDWLIEEALVSHPEIAGLTGRTAVSSVRIFTFVENGATEVVDGYFRILVGDSFTDNISTSKGSGRSGNLLGSIDVRCGIVVDAFRLCEGGVGVEYCLRHPDTDRDIVGFALPYWESVAELVARAARHFQPIVTIGWDVAITPSGPVLIEANEKYQHAGIGLGPVRVREQLEKLASRGIPVAGRK